MSITKERWRFRTWAWSLLLAAVGLALLWLALSGAVPAVSAGEVEPTENPYIEVIPGKLPLIIAVPHGGTVAPAGIPDRQQAVLINDWHSQAAGRELAEALEEATDHRPTLIINHLDRRKLDPNRSQAHGAQSDAAAEATWQSYHASIRLSGEEIAQRCSRGLFLDLHSYGGEAGLIQIGYGLDRIALEEDDEDLSKRRFIYASNIRALAQITGIDFAELVRGESSLGGLLEGAGYPTVPSPSQPEGFVGYYDGGYSTYLHGSRHQGIIDGLQIELPYRLLDQTSRSRLMGVLAESLVDYLEAYYQLDLESGAGVPCSAFSDVPPGHWASQAINNHYRAGLAAACSTSPRRFCPEEEIKRGEAVVWLWQVLHRRQDLESHGYTVFADVGPNASAVRSLWQRGIIEACSTQPLRFCPEEPLTRSQLSIWLLRAATGPNLVPSTPSASFADVGKNDWDGWWVEEAYRASLIQRCAEQPTARLCPQKPVTRAEWAWALEQALPVPKRLK